MKRDKAIKFERLAYLLLFRRHRYPGVRDWELEKYLGKDYESIISDFNEFISQLGLEVRRVEVEEGGRVINHYVVKPKHRLSFSEVKTYGWRIDDMAVLAVALAHIISGDGRASRREVEEVLKEKIPEWRVVRLLDRFIKLGYLTEDEEYLRIGLRTLLEIDIKKLTSRLIGYSLSEDVGTSGEDSSSQPGG